MGGMIPRSNGVGESVGRGPGMGPGNRPRSEQSLIVVVGLDFAECKRILLKVAKAREIPIGS